MSAKLFKTLSIVVLLSLALSLSPIAPTQPLHAAAEPCAVVAAIEMGRDTGLLVPLDGCTASSGGCPPM